jgi:hypothetical protein
MGGRRPGTNAGVKLFLGGDVMTGAEGIGGHEEYRDDLCLMYFPTVRPQGVRVEHTGDDLRQLTQ